MKKTFLLLTLLLVSIQLIAQVQVSGYYRSNGTYVQPHYRSSPDGNPYNNYSYPGNTNPYTGKTATGNPETYLRNYNNPPSSTNSNKYSNGSFSYESINSSSDTKNSAIISESSTNYKDEQLRRYNLKNYRFTSGMRVTIRKGALIISTPFEDAKLLGEATGGSAIVLKDRVDSWVYIQHDNLNGYINISWIDGIEMLDSPEYYKSKIVAITPVNRRIMLGSPIQNEPRDNAKILVKTKEKTIRQIGIYDKWFYYVEYNGAIGYMNKVWIME